MDINIIPFVLGFLFMVFLPVMVFIVDRVRRESKEPPKTDCKQGRGLK